MSESSGSANGSWPSSWELGEHSISVGRYIDPEFARLEYQKLWSKVWQVAARLDEIPEPGDYTTYDIGDQSVLVVRVDANLVKAYHNFCPHRGTALSEGCGQFENNRIICPFHGWRWNLMGRNQFVLERQEFCGGKLQESDVALREVKVEVYAGFVFISLAKNPLPFAEYIAPVRQLLDDLVIGDMHHYWWKSFDVAANWKVAQEAFLETYHTAATHPQLDKVGREIVYSGRADGPCLHSDVAYDALAHGHGRFYLDMNPTRGLMQESETGDPLEDLVVSTTRLWDGMDAMVLEDDINVLKSLRGKTLPDGSSHGAEYVRALYEHAAAQKRPMPALKPDVLAMWAGELFLFPNLMILPYAGNAMIYRIRPHASDPNRCRFEILSTRTYAATDKPPRATVQYVPDIQDPQQLGQIPRQDFANIPRIQRGLHSSDMRRTWLASHHEKTIRNMHQELDRYLQA